jgi:hypothetical protein
LHPERIIAIASTVKLKDGTIAVTSAARARTVLRHEHGHALDLLLAASGSPAFVAAHAKESLDLAAWTGRNLPPGVEDDILYFLQKGASGRQETFAELFAERFGGGTATLINVAEAMPQTRETVRAIMDDLSQKGGR